MTQALPKPLRNQLETAVKAAREVAETAAAAALLQLGVAEARVPDYLDVDRKLLRRRLRAHAQALGDRREADGRQAVQRLVWEVAYEHWHRMLFARFLAENGLLLWEPGVALSLEDCRELVDHDPDAALGARSAWELAGMLAARMLPQIFKPQNPVYALAFAPEHQRALEQLLAGLPAEVFHASDSLGWVYQFWQAKRKQQVNDAEVKIGADELPAVTQLFTEPYMVDFLLHNSLGAWWHTRHPDQPAPVPLPYLRTLDDGTPAAGRFEGWPDRLADFRLLDPCCGSGHFLVAAFLLLVPMRMAAEDLTSAEAVDAVLRENLHGLEIDPRCVEIAVFALALAAWRYPDLPSPSGRGGGPAGARLGVRAGMPAPQVACCGLKVAARAEDWMALVPDGTPHAAYLRQELGRLHAAFVQAPLLGSLLDPSRTLKNDLGSGGSSARLRELLETALAAEPAPGDAALGEAADGRHEQVLAARGLLEAARLLEGRYHLVVTNVPYLGVGLQAPELVGFARSYYPSAKLELALLFVERCAELLEKDSGFSALVTLGEWTYLGPYSKYRREFISKYQISFVVRLGWNAFSSGVRANPAVFMYSRRESGVDFQFIDGSSEKNFDGNLCVVRNAVFESCSVADILRNPDARFVFREKSESRLLMEFADARSGLHAGDLNQFFASFWEVAEKGVCWELAQTAVGKIEFFGGREKILLWEKESGRLAALAESVRHLNHAAQNWRAGKPFWGKRGIVVGLMGSIGCSLYSGDPFDSNSSALVPSDSVNLPAIWAFCESGEFSSAVRSIDNSLKVAPKTLLKVPFDLAHWQQVAAERYPNGLPKPYSDDPTQWIFHGHPQPALDPLQVAVARLAGYRWPAETDAQMELADEARDWIARAAALDAHTDDDGILCLPSVRGELPAHERLLKLLIDAWNVPDSAAASGSGVQPGSWKPAVLDKLLAEADCAGKGLDVWLRDKFFEQHCKRFHHRPFIWHLWDGQKDGFAALVNYHRLDAKNLERLIHTYLGDWIRQQEAGVRHGTDGAQTRLAAALDLKRRLELILEGEKPYDIFVRWKPLAEQPIGWTPDLNDGVRLNIRPFVTAEVLRHNKKPKLNIGWDKDRGKDVESAPWYPVFQGERINDHHLTLAEKRAARRGAL